MNIIYIYIYIYIWYYIYMVLYILYIYIYDCQRVHNAYCILQKLIYNIIIYI